LNDIAKIQHLNEHYGYWKRDKTKGICPELMNLNSEWNW